MSATATSRHRGKSGQQLRRGAAAAVIAMVVAATVLAMPEPAAARAAQPSIADVTVTRYGGADRYATSLAVAEAYAREAGGKLDTVVLVSGESWTSAVVAAPYAAKLGAPLLMTPPDELRDDAAEFLQRVGVSTVHLLRTYGTDDFIGFEVDVALTAHLGIDIEYIIGGDEYITASTVADKMGDAGVIPGFGRTAIVANGEVFADALVAGPFAARGGHPILLTPRDRLDLSARAGLAKAKAEHVIVMGGTAAISEEVEESITESGMSVTRLAGRTRYETAIKAANFIRNRYGDTAGQECFTTRRIGVARAGVPFDSFSSGPLLGRLCAPLVLADPSLVPAATASHLDQVRVWTASGGSPSLQAIIFGGEAAVSSAGLTSYLEAERDTAFTGIVTVGTRPIGGCGGAISDGPTRILDQRVQDPAWSPDCTKIVYAKGGQLWTMDRDGTQLQMLVGHDDGRVADPDWSPDGTRIVYHTQVLEPGTNSTSHVWVASIDGTGTSQLTFGDVSDDSPSWSPDSAQIAFRRIRGAGLDVQGQLVNAQFDLVTMRSSGFNPVVRTAFGEVGGSTKQSTDPVWSPKWSPSGDRIAFVSPAGFVYVIAPDSSRARPVASAANPGNGLSWSPDGDRIAFVRAASQGSYIVIADVDGLDEETVTDSVGGHPAPDWSPDGQRILFSSGKFVSATGARGTPIPVGARECRPQGVMGDTTAGFPLQDSVPTTGVVRVAVLFMDFPDAQAEHSTYREAELGLPRIETYLETVSYGKLDVEFVPLHRWLRAERDWDAYIARTPLGFALGQEASAHAVALADGEFDFSTVDLALSVFPSSHFGGGNAGGTAVADGVTVTTTRVNTIELRVGPRQLQDWGTIGRHEIAHSLGLVDMYSYESRLFPELPEGHRWGRSGFGPMGLGARFAVHQDDDIWRVGGSEMLAWNRWQLGWLSESQVHCLSGNRTTVKLSPVAQPGDGVAMAAVPVNTQGVLVVESRRPLGFDSVPTESSGTHDGNGVLVYTVDAAFQTGDLPIKIAGDSGDGYVDYLPLLQPGDSVRVRGYTVTVTADDGDTHTVTITRSS
ncbi:cell wall-binding repeat-containing protein [Candidatus Poriferisodalis sp.]|uniref:cell wall-binding repeat-containing protein n=1 Tax=Candidatus Poriferisodalis sp. TaxID=3101277 RepID=UPI003B5982AC